MDPRIAALKTTTFSGRRPVRRQIVHIRDTVALLSGNSRTELCKPIRECPGWKSAKGDYTVGACMDMLESLEREGIPGLPPAMIETVIEESRIRGSSCRAADWTRIGETRGKGKPTKGA